jgi:hypothetical protein
VELTPIDARDDGGIEQTIAGFTRESNCGLVVTASPWAFRRRELIIALAAKHRLPAVYLIPTSVPAHRHICGQDTQRGEAYASGEGRRQE